MERKNIENVANLSKHEKETIDEIKNMSIPLKNIWIEKNITYIIENHTDDLGDFGCNVYSYLKDRHYLRDNLTTKNCLIAKEVFLKNAIQCVLGVRDEYNEELSEFNEDDNTVDYADYIFGELVLSIIYGEKQGYEYPEYY